MPRSRHSMPILLQALRRRATGGMRLAVLLVFAFAVATQSLLGVLGEMHEITVHAHETQGMADHMAPHDHAAAVENGTDEHEGGPLHLLLHFTHCCGHSTWMSGGHAAIAVAAVAAVDVPVDRARRVSTPDLTNPFRPPIAV